MEVYPSVSFVLTCVTTQGPASMIVQAVCLPSGLKMLVIPIFLPIMPFISFLIYAIGYEDSLRLTILVYYSIDLETSIHRLQPTFSLRLHLPALRGSVKPEVPVVNKP